MRKDIYQALVQCLSAISGSDGQPAIRHVDLWNQNVEFIEQEEPWARPAVFIEFHDIEWQRTSLPTDTCRSRFSLHVVTDWKGSTSASAVDLADSLEAFDLLDVIHDEVSGLSGRTFSGVRLVASHTCHDHEQLLDNIETYEYRGERTI